jgi:hypothetical protein
MPINRISLEFRILLSAGIFALVFLALRPSTPVTKWEYNFWVKLASMFWDNDVEGFVGIALLMIFTVITTVLYQIVIRAINKRMQNGGNKNSA